MYQQVFNEFQNIPGCPKIKEVPPRYLTESRGVPLNLGGTWYIMITTLPNILTDFKGSQGVST